MKRAGILLGVALLLMTAPAAFGQSNPCNPCGGHMAVNPCFAKAGTVFYVNDPAGRNSVTFKSEAPLEDIVGTSSAVTGYLVFDPQNPEKGGKGELMVPVSTLATGIPLRDQHLAAADWLNAERFPNIAITITEVKDLKEVKAADGFQTYDVTFVGEFALHGKAQKIESSARITYMEESEKTRMRMPGNLLAVRASLDIPLADYDVTGPRGAGLIGTKVSETISVDVSLFATTHNPNMMADDNPCNPCGGNAKNPCNPCGM